MHTVGRERRLARQTSSLSDAVNLTCRPFNCLATAPAALRVLADDQHRLFRGTAELQMGGWLTLHHRQAISYFRLLAATETWPTSRFSSDERRCT